MTKDRARVVAINGPIVHIEHAAIQNGEQVAVGHLQLHGEVIELKRDHAVVQMYESTEGLSIGDSVKALGHPLSVELGPGLLGELFDGIQRPLKKLAQQGDFIKRGQNVEPLHRERIWRFEANGDLQVGQRLGAGDVLGFVDESERIRHKILLPPDLSGVLQQAPQNGDYRVDETIAVLTDDNGHEHPLKLFHRWPVRKPRPFFKRVDTEQPLLTGQRVLDCFFPLGKGGKAAVPGPFGAGKTMVQQQIARWCNADIMIYIGCGERGNELVDILRQFPQLTDPHTGRSLMERTLIIANTSNMPVVARESSIYVGMTIAEYYRDQGFDVVTVADSTSRWAEALREVAGRLGQMPVEEGYPAYLASRLAAFYERAGAVINHDQSRGSVSLIGAVSPPGGDFSEPVTSHTKEIIRTFWGLSKPLADARHYPAVSWTESFSNYIPQIQRWWHDQIGGNWVAHRKVLMAVLAEADELERIANLVGSEALGSQQRWTLEMASIIKEGFLQQSALDKVDSYCSPQKQYALMELMVRLNKTGRELTALQIPLDELLKIEQMTRVRRLKSAPADNPLDMINQFSDQLEASMQALADRYRSAQRQVSDETKL